MKFFVVCPYCGQDLLKAEGGSHMEIACPNCNKNLAIEVKDYLITVQEKEIEAESKDQSII